jgi:hypothetical protein
LLKICNTDHDNIFEEIQQQQLLDYEEEEEETEDDQSDHVSDDGDARGSGSDTSVEDEGMSK